MLRHLIHILLIVSIVAPKNGAASSVQDKVFSLILNTINEQINGKLEAETLEFSPPSTVTFINVHVKNTASRELFSAAQLRARINLTDLFSGTLTFEDFEAISPSAHLEINDGKLDLLSLFKSGEGKSQVVKFNKITIRNGQVSLKNGEKSSFSLQNLNVETGALDSDFKKIPLTKISGFFSATSTPLSAQLNGSLYIDNQPSNTKFSFKGSADSLAISSRLFKGVGIDASVVLQTDILQIEHLKLTSPEIKIDATGSYRLSDDMLDITVDGQVADSEFFFPDLDPNLHLKAASIKGTIKGPAVAPVIDTNLTTKWQDASIAGTVNYDLKSKHLNGHLSLIQNGNLALKPILNKEITLIGTNAKVLFAGTIEKISAQVSSTLKQLESPDLQLSGSDVSLTGSVTVDTERKSLTGNLKLNLAKGQFGGVDVSQGQILATIDGPWRNLSATGSLHGATILVKGFEADNADAKFVFQNSELKLSDILLGVQKGVLKLGSFAIHTTKNQIKGSGVIEQIDLMRAFFKEVPDSEANFNATFTISGTTHDPKLSLDGVIHDLTILGDDLGEVDVIVNFGGSTPHVAQISAAISNERGKADLRAAIDSRSQKINALLDFNEIQFNAILDSLRPWFLFGPSTLSGQLELRGLLSNPDANLSFVLNADRADPEMNLLAMNFGATLSNRKISFGGCANVHRRYKEDEPCQPSVPIKVKGDGLFRGPQDFVIDYNVLIDSDNFEKISDILRKEAIQLNMKVDVAGKLEKRPGQPFSNQVSASVATMEATVPDDQPIRLEQPFVLKWSGSEIVIEPKAHFLLSDGEFTLGGVFSKEKVAAEFDGRIPLYLARLLNRNIVEASGIASGNVVLSGTLENPQVHGSLNPDAGAYVRFRGLPAFEFESGEVRAGLDNENRRLIRVDLDNIRLKIGNGALSINGNFDFDRLADQQEDVLQHVDLSVFGSDLSATLRDFAIEGDVGLTVRTKDNVHWIEGSADVGAGKIILEYKLDGFEISAVQTAPSTFQWPAFFNRFKTKIDLNLSPFDLDADFGPFDFEGSIAGNDLKITGDLTQMRVFGNLELSLGVLKFPVVDFDIPTTAIPLKDTPGKIVDPEIDIKATAELRKDFGFEQDTSVELSLSGNLDHPHLALTPSSGERQLDQQKILAILLNMDLGPSILLRPLITKVEELLKAKTKTRFRIGQSIDEAGFNTKLSWRLNSRLEISGSYSSKDFGHGDVRFRLKLFDHLPIGKDVSFEGIYSFLSQDDKDATNSLQLNYRLFEK